LKNVGASVYAKLKNHARETGVDMAGLLRRYVQERLLYRLSISPEAGQFCLKGGVLLAAYNDGDLLRPTEDIDFNGFDGEGGVSSLEKALRAVLAIEVPDDGVVFKPETMRILKDREGIVPGGKVMLMASVGSANVDLRVDVGFGNAITPDVRLLEVPTLLGGSVPRPTIQAYPLETVIAEKLHAMAQFGEMNTRVKDHFDIMMLSRLHSFEGAVLADAIAKTFAHQRRPIPETFAGLGERYAASNAQAWARFISRSAPGTKVTLADAIAEVRTFIDPVAAAARDGVEPPGAWEPGAGWGAPAPIPGR